MARFKGAAVAETHLEAALSDPANLLIVAERDGQPLGFVWAHWLDRLRPERKHLFVYEIEVDPDHRRRGVGTALMRAVLDAAEARAADVFLFTNRSNEAAVAFFAGLGGRVENGDDLLFVYPVEGGGMSGS